MMDLQKIKKYFPLNAHKIKILKDNISDLKYAWNPQLKLYNQFVIKYQYWPHVQHTLGRGRDL